MIDVQLYFQLVFYTICMIGTALICILPKRQERRSIQNQLPTYNNDSHIENVKYLDTISY